MDACPTSVRPPARASVGSGPGWAATQKSKSGAFSIRAVGLVGQAAGRVPRVAGRHLLRPEDLARFRSSAMNESLVFDGGIAVVVARGDVERIAPGSIAGLLQTAAPDGPHNCVPIVFFIVGNGTSGMVYVCQMFCRWRRRGRHDPRKCAALVGRRGAGAFFARRHRHVEAAVVESRGARDAGDGVRFDFVFQSSFRFRRRARRRSRSHRRKRRVSLPAAS